MGYKIYSENCFLKIDADIYGPIKVLISDKYRYTEGPKTVLVNEALSDILCLKRQDGALISQNVPIYLANNIPIDINTIRKSYTVKRKEDDADYVVFAPFYVSFRYWLGNMHYFPENDIMLRYDLFDAAELVAIKHELNLQGDGLKLDDSYLSGISDPKNNLEKLIRHKFTKPVIYHTQLDLTCGDPVTLDVLGLTRRLGAVNFNASDAEKNFLLNIEALSNYNWRQYKCSIGIILRSLMYEKDAVYRSVKCRLKSQNKTVKDVLSCHSVYDFVGKDDFELAQDFVARLLNIDHYPMFVSTKQILSKLTDNGISVQEFEKLFGAVAKLQKNEYVEQKSED